MFDGRKYYTSGVGRVVSMEVIFAITEDVVSLAKEQNGLDYLVVYQHRETGQKLFFIDLLTKEEVLSGKHQKEEHYGTLSLASEHWPSHVNGYYFRLSVL